MGAFGTLSETGAFRQELDDLTGQVKLAESDLEATRERSAWADRMVKKNLMAPAQAQAERSKMESSYEKLRSLQAKRNQLLTYDRRQRVTDLKSSSSRPAGRSTWSRTWPSRRSSRAETEKRSKRSVYVQEKEKLHDISEQIKECKLYAAQDGMIV